jgi:hypothetical protein
MPNVRKAAVCGASMVVIIIVLIVIIPMLLMHGLPKQNVIIARTVILKMATVHYVQRILNRMRIRAIAFVTKVIIYPTVPVIPVQTELFRLLPKRPVMPNVRKAAVCGVSIMVIIIVLIVIILAVFTHGSPKKNATTARTDTLKTANVRCVQREKSLIPTEQIVSSIKKHLR